jgi:hypothetical protein
MSVDQRVASEPAHEEPDVELRDAKLRECVEKWFADQGVPQFAGRYLPEDRLRFLVLPWPCWSPSRSARPPSSSRSPRC